MVQHMTRALFILAAVALVALAPLACDRAGKPDGGSAKSPDQATGYHCPMHPAFHSDKPGVCGICGMNLVPDAPPAAKPAAGAPEEHAGHATGGVAGMPGMDHGGAEAPSAPASGATGTITVSPEKQQMIGVKIVPVGRRDIIHEIRAVGRVEVDERSVAHLHTKVEGWVEKLYVNTTGQRVRRGDPLYEVYSPKLLSTQQEYLIALRARRALQSASLPEARASGDALVESARRRLELWDVPASAIRALERTGRPSRMITFFSPVDGVVLEKMAVEGLRVDQGTDLLTVADLSRLWILADVYEHDLPFVHEGQEATVSLSYLPGRAFQGKVLYVYPTLDEKTRTVKVRLEIPNPEGILKPGMFADVRLESAMRGVLAVPDSAILDSGMRQVVFASLGAGRFEPRQVRPGRRAEGFTEILSGLAEGERVVAAAAFMLDAESKLAEAAGAAGHAGHGKPEEK